MKLFRRKKLAKLDDDFITRNKQALMEEMVDALNNLNTLVSQAAQAGPTEQAEHELSMMKNYLIAIGQNLGSLSTLFNQYLVFETGELPKARPLGFQAMIGNNNDE
jgi:hypothetical protein